MIPVKVRKSKKLSTRQIVIRIISIPAYRFKRDVRGKPLQLENLNMKELEIVNLKLEYSRDLDELINQPVVTKNIFWFTYRSIAVIAIIASLSSLNILLKKEKEKRIRQKKNSESSTKPQETPRRLSRIVPQN